MTFSALTVNLTVSGLGLELELGQGHIPVHKTYLLTNRPMNKNTLPIDIYQ